MSEEVVDSYKSLLSKVDKNLSKVQLRFLLELMSHQLAHPEQVPTLHLELFYHKGIDVTAKVKELSNKLDRVPAVYDNGTHFVIEPRLTLAGIEEFVRDSDVEFITGDVVCCGMSLLSSKVMHY